MKEYITITKASKLCNKNKISLLKIIKYLEIDIYVHNKYNYIKIDTLESIISFLSTHTSNDIKRILTQKTNLEKYGVENPSQNSDIKNKKKQTLLSNYGVENPMHSKQVVTSIKNIWKNKSKEEIKALTNKSKTTKLIKYGEENYNNKSSISKTKQLRTKEQINQETLKIKTTKLIKYGDANYQNVDKIKKTKKERYGDENYCNIDKIKESRKNKIKMFEDNNKDLFSIKNLSELFNKDITTISQTIKKLGINVYNSSFCDYYINKNDFIILKEYFDTTLNNGISYCEKEVVTFLKENTSFTIIENSRNLLGGLELDIYIPEKQVAIEINGLYWHSTAIYFNKENLQKKDIKYYTNIIKYKHLEKTKKCESLGIRLIHLWDLEWNTKKDICKSILLSSLGIYENKYFARNLIVKELSKKEIRNFFNENHIQSFSIQGNYGLGLFDINTEECIQVVSYNINNNKHSKNESSVWELNRMATKLNTQVLGGFSKLLFYTYKYNSNLEGITSYISRRLFNGKGYYKIGFNKTSINQPQSFYYINKKIFSRDYGKKSNFKKRFNNGEGLYKEGLTENELAWINKLPKVFDCGTIKIKHFR